MKLLIDQSPENEAVEIIIKCGLIDARLEKLIEQVRLYFFSVAAKRDGKTFQLRLEDIFYFESVDSHTFAYTEKEVYECSMRLYELEDQIAKTDFVRISKSCILNVTTLRKCARAAQRQNGSRARKWGKGRRHPPLCGSAQEKTRFVRRAERWRNSNFMLRWTAFPLPY